MPGRLLPNACDRAYLDVAALLTLPLTSRPSALWESSAAGGGGGGSLAACADLPFFSAAFALAPGCEEAGTAARTAAGGKGFTAVWISASDSSFSSTGGGAAAASALTVASKCSGAKHRSATSTVTLPSGRLGKK